jgi:hypothetical protein
VDSVFPEVRDELRLRGRHTRVADEGDGHYESDKRGRESRLRDARAHKRYLGHEEQRLELAAILL